MYTFWWIWTYAYTCYTISTIKVINIFITSKKKKKSSIMNDWRVMSCFLNVIRGREQKRENNIQWAPTSHGILQTSSHSILRITFWGRYFVSEMTASNKLSFAQGVTQAARIRTRIPILIWLTYIQFSLQ